MSSYPVLAPNPRSFMHRGQNAANAMQPWRCAGCNTAVRPGFNDPCRCPAFAALRGDSRK